MEETNLTKEIVKAIVVSTALTVLTYAFKKALFKSVAQAGLRAQRVSTS